MLCERAVKFHKESARRISIFDRSSLLLARMTGKKIMIFWSLLVILAIGAAQESEPIDYETKIDQGVLKSVEQLRKTDKLDLSNREIREIDVGVFNNISVKYLNLESNEIFRLDADTFVGLDVELEEVNLSSNLIKVMNSSFASFDNLKLLNLSNNPLKYLDLRGIPKIVDIIVKGNKLQWVNERFFSQEFINDDIDEDDGDEIEDDVLDALDDDYEAADNDDDDDFDDDDFDDDDEDEDEDDEDHHHKDTSSDIRLIICIEDSILKKVDSFKQNEPLPTDCVDTITSHGYSIDDEYIMYVKLQDRGIQGVAKGWFQLESTHDTYIDLSHNNLTELSPELLNDLPKFVKKVKFSNNLINRIKRDIIKNRNLLELKFEANLIEEVEDGSFEHSNLSALNFKGNEISDIGFVASLPTSLRRLNLNENEISYIEDGVFSRLENVTYLNLARNNITKIQANAFQGLTSLHKVDLSHNEISEIEAGGFSGPKKLRHIVLYHNLISSCDDGVFNHLEYLKFLHFGHNNFTEISKNNCATFPGNLRALHLNGNEITDIENGFFVGVPKHYLNLANNKLSKLLPNQFQIDNLRELALSDNLLTEIDPDSFQGLPKLDFLTLAGNQITEIPEGLTKHLGRRVALDLSRNPFTKLLNEALSFGPSPNVYEIRVVRNVIEIIQGGIFKGI